MGLFDGSNTGAIIGGLAGGGLGALVGYGVDSGNRAAAAAGQASAAQLAQQEADRQQALGFAGMTPQQEQMLEQNIALNSQDISRKQALLASADPALIEAGHQALALMKGQDAATLAPLRNQLSQQRQALQSTLAQQLGPDYANSSAGIQALQSFDTQAANTLANQQQSTLNQLLGVTQNTEQSGNLSSNMSAGLGNLQTSRGVNAAQMTALGSPVNPALAYTGQLASAQQGIGYANTALSLGGALGSAFLSGGMSGAGGATSGSSSSASPYAPSQTPYTTANYNMPTFGSGH